MSSVVAEFLAMEDAGLERIDAAIEQLAPDLAQVWGYGDGFGGALFDHIAKRLVSLGYVECHTERTRGILPPTRRTRDKISPRLRRQIMERDRYRCQKCGGHKDLSIDHIYPESLGGESTPENLQVLCMPCNLSKGAKPE